jgi:hypothetical protein
MSGIIAAGAIGLASSVIGGIFGASKAKKAARQAKKDQAVAQAKLTFLENSRQDIINPYSNTKDLSSLATDLSGSMTNPFANLGVATQAAKMQIEQADISLANTLDTLMSTGSSAGGATALAQAALQSKQGVSASIEQQEAANEKLKAQGQVTLEQMKVSEAQRLQGIQISEGQRTQQADAAGQSYEFQARENRQVAGLNRAAGLVDGAQARLTQAKSDQAGAITGMFSSIAGVAGSAMGAFAGGASGSGGGGTSGTSGTNGSSGMSVAQMQKNYSNPITWSPPGE